MDFSRSASIQRPTQTGAAFSEAELSALPEALELAKAYLSEPNEPLKVGSNGPEAISLQRGLKMAGYDIEQIRLGLSQDDTAQVSRFQKATGLSVTGEADHDTFRQLAKTLRAMSAHPGDIVPGMRSSTMGAAERSLSKLGYDTGTSDAVYDVADAGPVQAFNKDQRGPEHLRLTQRTLKTLSAEAKALEHKPWTQRVTDSRDERALDAKVAQAAKAGVRQGDRGEHVAQLQRRLRGSGYAPKHVNGVFDERTAGALKAFQRAEGLKQTGELDTRTWNRLQKTIRYADGPASPAQRAGERSQAVMRSERMLRKSGFAPGALDGFYDGKTVKAQKLFERRTDRKVDGTISASDYQRLQQFSRGPATDSRLTKVALDWARNVRLNPNNGAYNWNEYCQGFVNRVTDASGHPNLVSWSPTANAAYYNARARGVLRTDFANMKGNSVLYWNVRTNGHIAIATDMIGPDGMPMVLSTGSVLWFYTPGAKLITWTEMLNEPFLGLPTAYSPANLS